MSRHRFVRNMDLDGTSLFSLQGNLLCRRARGAPMGLPLSRRAVSRDPPRLRCSIPAARMRADE